MDNLPARLPPSEGAIRPIARVGALDLYQALITDARCENTRSAREHDIRVFQAFLGETDPAVACALLVTQGRGTANAIAMAFRRFEQERGSASGSINRRLSALRRLVTLARRFDVIEWVMDVDSFKVETFRDTTGPGLDGWRKLWKAAVDAGDTPIARRDRAFIRLLHDSALRVNEVLGIDYPEDLDLTNSRVMIKGKGWKSKSWLTISPKCVTLIREWLDARGDRPGPLITSRPRVDNKVRVAMARQVVELQAAGITYREIAARWNAEGLTTSHGKPWNRHAVILFAARGQFAPPRRMNQRNANRLLDELSVAAGLERRAKPHGLRHHAVTRILDLTGGNVRAAMKFARHCKPETTLRYDDNRTDLAGEMTRLLGEDD